MPQYTKTMPVVKGLPVSAHTYSRGETFHVPDSLWGMVSADNSPKEIVQLAGPFVNRVFGKLLKR